MKRISQWYGIVWYGIAAAFLSLLEGKKKKKKNGVGINSYRQKVQTTEHLLLYETSLPPTTSHPLRRRSRSAFSSSAASFGRITI